jgi:immune inhibitor A
MKSIAIFISIFIIIITIIMVCVCVIIGLSTYNFFYANQSAYLEALLPIESATSNQISTDTNTPESTGSYEQSPTSIIKRTENNKTTPESLKPIIIPTQKSSSTLPNITEETFKQTIIPINDPLDLAYRFEGKQNLPKKLEYPVVIYQLGSQESFWVIDTDKNENFQVNATLQYITDHVYFWIENSINFDENHLSNLVETFENEIYPTNRNFFGEEWIPGVDADPHLFILYTGNLGASVAGYFSTIDEYLPIVQEYSNGHEMFFLNADHLDLNEEYTYSVLAHEFQHMIHWKQDRNEDTWINEGFSNLAVLLNGYHVGGADRSYANDPDIQLNHWPNGSSASPYYGASFLFMTYFLDRFGDDATKALVIEPTNGLRSIDKVLSDFGIIDEITNHIISADDVFSDWVIASYLQDPDIGDGRYTYNNYKEAPKPSITENIRVCPHKPIQNEVSQYGVDYYRITCQGDYWINFEGNTETNVLPADPFSGNYAFYSNQGDEADMTLTKKFDFSKQEVPLTLSYWIWYDIEKDYDYLYLSASTDGDTWQILTTPSGTPDDPTGNSYGWAYNGLSGNSPKWIHESVDISQFAGKEVQFRFEYITDAAVNGEGFLVDDISIPEIDYFAGFENDDDGWNAEGFVRIQNSLPQHFSLSIIRIGKDTIIEKISMPIDNNISIPLHISETEDEVILVISGLTRYTRQKAQYSISITQ